MLNMKPQSVDMWGQRTKVPGVHKWRPVHHALPIILRCRDMSCEILSDHRPQVLRARGEIAVLENYTPFFQSDIDIICVVSQHIILEILLLVRNFLCNICSYFEIKEIIQIVWKRSFDPFLIDKGI
jgi:hypothetical protein